MLSHHQLFSAWSQIGKKDQSGKLVPYNKRLKTMFDDFRSTGKPIPAWFWGHEHNLGIYEPYLDLKHGRCVGHSAVPVFDGRTLHANQSSGPAAEGRRNTHKLPTVGNVYTHGFAMLTLRCRRQSKGRILQQWRRG